MALRIEAIPAFADNYIWALHDHGRCVLVDPGEVGPVLDFLSVNALEPCAIVLTHHHPDHIGGVASLLRRWSIPVHGPNDERMPEATRPVVEGDHVMIPELGLGLAVLETPGHTRSHIVFHGHGLLLCGDTLFSSGCGRLFEGTPEQMQASLDKLSALPDATQVHCAHEYTEANCRFALQVEPDNRDLQSRAAEVRRMRAAGRITLPTTLGEEKRFNPFLRTREPAVVAAARSREPDSANTPAAVFGVIRRWKDTG